MAFWKNNRKGQFLIEIMIAAGLFTLFAGAFTLLAIDASRFTTTNATLEQAFWLGREAQEAVTDIWFSDASNLTSGTHGIAISAQAWHLTPTPDVHNTLQRSLQITSAHRTTQGDLAATGTPDTNTKKVTIAILNQATGKTLFSDVMYFPTIGSTPVPSGPSWLETTLADFQDGTFTDTQTSNVSGGEVTLEVGQTAGTYLSSNFNTGSNSTSYQSLTWSGAYGVVSDIHIQIRVAQNQNQLSSGSWFGPDGTGATYFQTGDSITTPGGVSGTRWIQYRVEFTKSTATVPRLNDIKIFYAP